MIRRAGGMKQIQKYTFHLGRYLVTQLRSLTHSSGCPLCTVFEWSNDSNNSSSSSSSSHHINPEVNFGLGVSPQTQGNVC